MEPGLNTELLRSVSKYFTEETLRSILIKATNDESAVVTGWSFGEASVKGDGYLSIVSKVAIFGENNKGNVCVKTVVKSLPSNIGRRKTFRSTEFFRNEIAFYSQVVPEFLKFLREKHQENLLNIPRCYAFYGDGDNDYLVLEDVSELGYGPFTRQNPLTVAQCKLVLKTMARFHAVSFGYKNQHPQEFKRCVDRLEETYFHEKLWGWYENLHRMLVNVAKDALSKEYPESEAEKRFSSREFGSLYHTSAKLCSRREAATSVLTQGDAWAPNFLVRQLEGHESKALMLDFQLVRCASVVTDVVFFIYACTDKPLRDEHYGELLLTYYDELYSAIALLGCDPKAIYPWDVFMQEVKEQGIVGLTFSLEAVPFTMMDESESLDLDALVKDDDAVDVSKVFYVPYLKEQWRRRRLADIIVHAVENGYI